MNKDNDEKRKVCSTIFSQKGEIECHDERIEPWFISHYFDSLVHLIWYRRVRHDNHHNFFEAFNKYFPLPVESSPMEYSTTFSQSQ